MVIGIKDFKKGNVAFRRGDYQVAIDHYNSAIASNSSFYVYYENLGHAYKAIGYYSEASQSYELAKRFRDKPSIDLTKHSQHCEYGGIRPSISEWKRKWDGSPGKRVLFYSTKDFSGSFYKWALSLNLYTDFAVRMVSFTAHQYGYPADILYDGKNFCRKGFERLLEECDIIHVKDEYGLYLCAIQDPKSKRFIDQVNILRKFFHKPLIYTHYGGFARKFARDPSYRSFVTETFQAKVAMTPDLNFDWFDGYFIPHSIDVSSNPYSWRDGNIICHSPSTAVRKGTQNFVEAVQKVGGDFYYEHIENVSHSECVKRKSKATIFFDQAGREDVNSLGIDDVIGWYGNSALEAMVYGIPTIAHISEVARAGAARAGKSLVGLPIISVGLDSESMYQALFNFFSSLSTQDRLRISFDTRRWVENFHSYEVTSDELASVYESLLK